MPALKLTYFDMPGRAEVIRSTLKLGGVAFEDNRISRDKLKQIKPSLPYGKIPVLTVDGVRYAESQALLRYAAQLGGLYPPADDPIAAALVDEVVDTINDFFERLLAPSFAAKDEAKRNQLVLALLEGPLPLVLQSLDARLGEIATYQFFKNANKKPFMHEVVVADCVAFLKIDGYDPIPKTVTDAYANLTAIFNKVESALKASVPPRARADTSTLQRVVCVPQRIKLSYFDAGGIAEPLRLAMTVGGLAFEDERLSYDDFTKRRTSVRTESCPYWTSFSRNRLLSSASLAASPDSTRRWMRWLR